MEKNFLSEVRRRLSANVDRGTLTWIDATASHPRLNGKEAGTLRPTSRGNKSYWHVKFNGKAIKRSHLIFFFSTGRWPTLQIDHINGDSSDDRACNLREATQQQNSWNHKSRKKDSSCAMGVRKLPSGRFQARITKDQRSHAIGSFLTHEEAVSAYQQQRKEKFGDYA